MYCAPLETLVAGGANKFAQAAAAHCLCEFVTHLKQLGKVEFLMFAMPKYVALFLVQDSHFDNQKIEEQQRLARPGPHAAGAS